VERLTRLIVLASTLAAGAAYAVLVAPVGPGIPWAAAAAFIVTFALARVALPLGLTPALLFAYLSPAVLMVAFRTAEYHHILIWLAALAGPVVAGSDWSRWHVPPAWKAPLAAWALVVACTWPVIAGREVDFSPIAYATLDTPNALQGGPPALTAAWIVSVALGQLLGILWLDLLWARFGAERLRRAERVVLVPLVISIAISSAAGLYQRYADIDWLNVGDWPSLNRASGLMLDANSFGTAAGMLAPAVIALAWRLGRPLWMAVPIALLLMGGMWSSGSRTALLTSVAGFIAVAIALGARARAWQARLAPVALLLGAAVLVLVAALQSDDRSNPLTRLLETLPSAEDGGLPRLAEDLWSRNGYGLAAARAIGEHPWTGIGIGAFNMLSSDYAYLATGAVIPADNAQNWWRHQVAELGFAGAAPSLLFSFVVVLLLWKGTASGDHAPAATVVRGVLVGVGLASLLGVATQHPALWLTFVTLLYWLGALSDSTPAPAPPAWTQRATWAAAILLALGVAAGQARSAMDDLRVPIRAVHLGFPYGYGFSAPATDPEFGEVRWTAQHAVAVLQAQHAYFQLTAWAPHEDLAANPVRVRLWRGTTPAADLDVRSAEPVTRLLSVPAGQRYLMIETDVSRLAANGRGLKIAGRWLREVPVNTPPELVIR
jgi:hypothetical protein